ncbi:MAG: asparaginase domain-containing protein [Hydrogenophilus sp.]|nr:asparaginase domain-containing protein [Hydrogenophilus sp.]
MSSPFILPPHLTHLPHIAWIATGGTIAGSGNAHYYQAASFSPTALLNRWALTPPLPLRLLTPFQIDSKNATPSHWCQLHSAVTHALTTAGCRGVVITHGTDTLEETAAFLTLTLLPSRPVVLTGAMRPADDPQTDGPTHFAGALAYAAAPTSPPEVVISFAGTCWPALGFRKIATRSAVPFAIESPLLTASPQSSPSRAPAETARPHLEPPPLIERLPPPPLLVPQRWPRISLLSATPLDEPAILTHLLDNVGIEGAVLLLPGHGSVPDAWYSVIAAAARTIPIVRASRCALGPVSPHPIDSELGTIAAGHLPPSQARVALSLWLAQLRNR